MSLNSSLWLFCGQDQPTVNSVICDIFCHSQKLRSRWSSCQSWPATLQHFYQEKYTYRSSGGFKSFCFSASASAVSQSQSPAALADMLQTVYTKPSEVKSICRPCRLTKVFMLQLRHNIRHRWPITIKKVSL